MIEPFRPTVAPEVISDLHVRLRATRWPRGVVDSGGVPLSDLREIVRYWVEELDWPQREREINRLPHFLADVGGLRLHFIHAKSPRPDARPLLLLHGWPGSFVEMLEIVPLLAEEFHVVVPSLPGYGFSEAPTAAGMSNARIADLFAELMTLLGYDRFAAQGGDWGAGIATWLAVRFPSRVAGIHLNYIPGSYAPFVEGEPSAEEAASLRRRDRWIDEDGAYGHVQRTRPLTLGYALSDSPAGLAAWIVEKFREWADPRSAIPLDRILTNVTIYWATNTITSSMRLYQESSRTPLRFERGERVPVPCGIARFPREAPFPPRSWIERAYDVVHWTDMPQGGHFAALEAPEALAEDVVKFLRGLDG
ncbi:MAG TPA: alpha/beta fold hydrolase [Thermoanaerobaculia bacterium]|jgi:pimeloyl-ACP methyl ester carboxylesterase|nr:alpha/beta fold hydrolase [Thermoanaerobaculia bacterium]